MTQLDRVVVVGAGAAGLAAAEVVRRNGFAGTLSIVGAEAHLPYDRPPLSKQILRGAWEHEKVTLRKPEAFDALDAQWLRGTAAAGLDTGARVVSLADGRPVPYDGLVIATGVTPRALRQGHDLGGVHLLRTIDDALALREGLRQAKTVVVVGAGFLGTEVAAVAAELDCAVTMVDPLPAPLIRQLGKQVGELVATLHGERGVSVRCGVGVRELIGDDGRVTGVNLDNGETEPADLVLVAIGSTPATGWLTGSGVALDDGVLCDAHCQVMPGVVAAGDVARWMHPELGPTRIEHRMNATEQGMAAARTLLGDGTPFRPVPYFWTDQYDVKIQVYGLPSDDADLHVHSGDPGSGPFAALYSVHGRVTAALAWQRPRAARELRQLVVDRVPVKEALATSGT